MSKNTYNKIINAKNMQDLTSALKEIDALQSEAKTALYDALEKYVVSELTVSDEDLFMAESLTEIAKGIFGEGTFDALMGQDGIYEFHGLAKIASQVQGFKKDKTDTKIVTLLAEMSKLSDQDYNSASKLSDLFMMVSKGQDKQAPNKPKPNPFKK